MGEVERERASERERERRGVVRLVEIVDKPRLLVQLRESERGRERERESE